MALEIDALISSIEDEKLQDEEREKVRDLFARIEGIKDKVRFLILLFELSLTMLDRRSWLLEALVPYSRRHLSGSPRPPSPRPSHQTRLPTLDERPLTPPLAMPVPPPRPLTTSTLRTCPSIDA